MPAQRHGAPIWWSSFSAPEFTQVDPASTIAVLPVAATEQHGPHLPLSTDTAIMEGMLETVAGMLPGGLDLRVLPIQAVGKSDEHLFAAGTLSLPAPLLIDMWVALGAAAARAGIRKLVIVNSHGGNEEVMGIVARTLRIQHRMLVAKTSWLRFEHPDNLYSASELRHGIHAGDVETSLMLHFRPDLVDMEQAETFPSAGENAEARFTHLRAHGRHSFAWVAPDLHPSGAVGDAQAATAAKGAASAEWQAKGFIELLEDMRRADVDAMLAHGGGAA